MVHILINHPIRMTPPWKAFPVAWTSCVFDQAAWDGYGLLLLCRGARIPAVKVTCEADSYSGPNGWTKSYGALWLTQEGQYIVKTCDEDAEKFRDGVSEPNLMRKALPDLPYYYSGYSPNSHHWVPPGYDMDDS